MGLAFSFSLQTAELHEILDIITISPTLLMTFIIDVTYSSLVTASPCWKDVMGQDVLLTMKAHVMSMMS